MERIADERENGAAHRGRPSAPRDRFRIASASCPPQVLPPPVHPVPLLWVAQDQSFEHRVVRACVATDLLARVSRIRSSPSLPRSAARACRRARASSTRARRERRWRARAWRGCGTSTPGGRRSRPGCRRRPGVLIERKHDYVAGLEPIERSCRASLAWKQPEARRDGSASRRKRSSQRGLIGRRTKWKRPCTCGNWPMPATVATSQLPKWPVSTSTPLPAGERAGERIVRSRRARSRASCALRRASGSAELADELPEMRVMRLREPRDLCVGQRFAEHAAQIVDDHAPAQREAVGRRSGRRAEPRPCSGTRERDRRRADAVVRERQRDRRDAIPLEHRRCALADHRLRRAVVVARHREVRRLDLAQRGLAREKLEAGFLRGEARGEARRAPGAVAAIRQLLRREELAQIPGGRLAQQTFDARDLDRVDPAARRDVGQRGARRIRCAVSSARARASAALVPAKPRQSTSATSLRGAAARATTGTPAQPGSSAAKRRDARHGAVAQRRRARAPSRGFRPRR